MEILSVKQKYESDSRKSQRWSTTFWFGQESLSCCCDGTSIVSIKKITNGGREIEITRVDKYRKSLASDKTPEKTDDEKCFNSHIHIKYEFVQRV